MTRSSVYYIFQKKVLDSETYAGYKIKYEEVCRGTRLVGNGLTITQALDDVPTASITIPIEDLPKDDKGIPVTNLNNYRVLLSVMVNNKRKYGMACIVESIEVNYEDEIATLSLAHRMAEMKQWLMPINLVVKNMPLGHCVENVAKLSFPDDYVKNEQVLRQIGYLTNLTVNKDYPILPIGTATRHIQANPDVLSPVERLYVPQEIPVTIEMDAYAYNTKLEMNFSSTNKLEALAEIMKNTKDLHFLGTISGHEMWYEPTNGNFGDGVKISNFQDECDYSIIVSQNVLDYDLEECDFNPAKDISLVTMLGDPVCSQDLTDHFNRAAVFCGDVGEGVLHLTLKEIYENKATLEDPLFPVEKYEFNINLQPDAVYDNKTHKKINNEKVYENIDIPVMANNENREYYVTDLEQLGKDNGAVYHTVYNFSDLYPIPDLEYTDENDKKVELEITDADRIEITKRAYNRAIRFLKAQRPQWQYQFNTTALPAVDMVGKRVRFLYDKKVSRVDECGEPTEITIAHVDECFYITQRIISFDPELNEVATITLDKELRPNTNPEMAYKLHEKAKTPDVTTSSELGTLYPEYGRTSYNDAMDSETIDRRTPIYVPDTGIPKDD